jgi:predicted DNA-binding protein (MmcQ/YjbR family)
MPDVDWLRKLCLSFPDVTEDMPWGDDLCFKVRGKIFTGMVLSDGRFPRITLKCARKIPRAAGDRRHSPAPYVGRYKWVMLANSNVLPAAELEALIRQSYDLVAAKAPKKKAAPKKAPRKRAAK